MKLKSVLFGFLIGVFVTLMSVGIYQMIFDKPPVTCKLEKNKDEINGEQIEVVFDSIKVTAYFTSGIIEGISWKQPYNGFDYYGYASVKIFKGIGLGFVDTPEGKKVFSCLYDK